MPGNKGKYIRWKSNTLKWFTTWAQTYVNVMSYTVDEYGEEISSLCFVAIGDQQMRQNT